jgi:hypothetical protein
LRSYHDIERYIRDMKRGRTRFLISIGLPACRLDISESMTAQWQGHGDKKARKGMNNGYLYHGSQWDLCRSRFADPLYGNAFAEVCELRIESVDFSNGLYQRHWLEAGIGRTKPAGINAIIV